MQKSPKKNKASRQGKRNLGVRIRLGAVVLALLLVLSASLYGFYRFATSSTVRATFRLQKLDIRGAEHVDVAQLRQLISSTFLANTLSIPLERVRNLVESETWVQSATVRRELPDALTIHIVERRPIAVAVIDGDLRVVDSEGVILAPYGPDFENIDLPIVKGLKNLAIENAREENARKMKLYVQVLSELDSGDRKYSDSISEVIVDDPVGVAVIPEQEAFRLNLGTSDFLQHYHVYLSGLDYLHEVKEAHGAIDSVDVTFDNKIVVRTPSSSEPGASGE